MSIKQKTFSTFVATFAVALALGLSVAPMAAKKMRPEPTPAQLQADLQTQRVERGKYIVSTAGCHDCHTPWKMGPKGPEPDMTLALSGHPAGMKLPPPPKLGEGPWVWTAAGTNTAFAGPWGVSYTANLTPDPETGLGKWTLRDFMATLRTGRHRASAEAAASCFPGVRTGPGSCRARGLSVPLSRGCGSRGSRRC